MDQFATRLAAEKVSRFEAIEQELGVKIAVCATPDSMYQITDPDAYDLIVSMYGTRDGRGHNWSSHSFTLNGRDRQPADATPDYLDVFEITEPYDPDTTLTPVTIRSFSNDGVTVGGYSPRRFYSYLGVNRSMFANANVLDSEFMEEAFWNPIRLAVSPDFIAEYDAQQVEVRKAALLGFAKTLYSREARAAAQQLQRERRNLIIHQDGVAASTTSIRALEERCAACEVVNRDGNNAERLAAEYDLISAHPRCGRISFVDQSIVIETTDDLRLYDVENDHSVHLGAFRITIYPLNGQIHMQNLSTRRHGMDHPHIEDERPCFGDHHGAFQQLLTNGELYSLFDLLIQYLETYNRWDSMGSYASYWLDEPDARPLPGPSSDMSIEDAQFAMAGDEAGSFDAAAQGA